MIKKFGDDAGSVLTALITYYGFVAIFPLLLVFVTILGLLSTNSSFAHSLENSALAQFPVIGNQLKANVSALHSGSVVGLVIGLLLALYGSLGVSQAAQRAMAEVWNVPGVVRPGFFPRLTRSLTFLAVLAGNVLITTGVTSLSTYGAQVGLFRNMGFKVGVEALVVLINVAVYWLAFRVLTPASIGTRELFPGAVLGGVGWTVLQGLGVYLVGHNLRHAGQVYGTFALVLGTLAWIYVGAELSLYAAEVNVVLKNRLWPRSIVQPPLTDADREVLDRIASVGERRPEQHVESYFDGDDEAAGNGGGSERRLGGPGDDRP
ncbi:MAG TPA: YihY/virulence factor BrkB family protein [Acidimicrobiales bacterium]|nr:YihY/virulence factor BrkB family protein [Acidimicrobiales bacterium]